MMLLLDIVAWVCAALVIIPLSILLGELSAGQLKQRESFELLDNFPESVVVMPAHNEGLIIAETVRIMLDRMAPNSSLLVIADNCDDDTAIQAQMAGAAVAVRNDPTKRGKGYALAHAAEVLSKAPPAYVVVLDADCQSTVGSLSKLIAAAAITGLPIQAANVMTAPASSSPMVQISNFAFYIKNIVRQRGMMRIGKTAILTGTGFAVSWKQFCFSAVPTGEIVEDLVMGLRLTECAEPPLFMQAARVESLAAGQIDTLKQRQRWEHGFVSAALNQALPCLVMGAKKRNWALFWTGLHLLVPPLVMLLLATLCLIAGQIGLALFGASWLPLLTISCLLSLIFALLFLSWLGGGSAFLSGQALLKIPSYLIWKLPIYKKLAGQKQNSWNRTPRSGE
jgi:cellulose synthase/poly-beta-1,6-N-acetylglucosamine synthase-like glycosyltransferase